MTRQAILLSSLLIALASKQSHSAPTSIPTTTTTSSTSILQHKRQISINIGADGPASPSNGNDAGDSGVTTSTITYYITQDPIAGFTSLAGETTTSTSAFSAASSSSSSSSTGDGGGGISSSSNTTAIEDTPLPILEPGQNPSNPASWTVYNADAVHYPFTVHLPDRTTRNLPPLDGPLPMVLSLSGSGGRGTAADAKRLSGYDGTSRFVRQYYEGNRSLAHTTAAEELLVVTPICPNETAQSDASWDINVFPNIIAQVVAAYNVDLTRIYLTTYSMGARAGWPLLMAYPDIFAGSIISSGATYAQSYQLQDLLGNSIRNYYGGDDESGLGPATVNTQEAYDTALANQIAKFPALATRYNSRKLETIGPLPGADHLVMNELPWQEQVLTDGYTGALSWLITQVKEEGATIPAYNSSVCTDCIPSMGGPDEN